MMKKYLKPNIAIEPLFCSWYLWGYLIPPHSAGFYLKNRYLKIMRSFLESPEIHRLAAKNPKLAGGQFMNIDDESLKKIEEIVRYTEKNARTLLQLTEDIIAFDALLQEMGDGSSLEPLYQQLPDTLKGSVELVYSQNNQPSIHIFEKILYDKYYNEGLQSVILSPLKDDTRQFVLSTPRIARDFELSLPLHFKSDILAKIVQSRTEGLDLEEIYESLPLSSQERALFETMFTDTPPATINNEYREEGIRIRYFGHACVLIQTQEISILIDPLISYFKPNEALERFTLDHLPSKIDYVLFTHNHLDHISFETLLFLKEKVGNFVFHQASSNTIINPNVKLSLEALGFKNLKTIEHLEELEIPGGKLFSFPFLGEHGCLDIQSKSAFYLELYNHSFLFAADSNNLDNSLYEYLHDKVGPIDTIFIGMECVGGPLDWIYGPLLSKNIKHAHKQSRRYSGSDSKKALSLVRTLQSQEVFVYAMGQESWLSHITSLNYEITSPQIVESDLFIQNCEDAGIQCKRLYGKDEWTYPFKEAKNHA